MKIKIQPDLEKARSIKRMIVSRKKFVESCKKKVFVTIICENYYEIIKELGTALCLTKGMKFMGQYAHKELIEEMVKLVGFDESLLTFLDDLRIRRNGSLYYGEAFNDSYMENNEDKLETIIRRIEKVLDKQIGVKDE